MRLYRWGMQFSQDEIDVPDEKGRRAGEEDVG